MPALSVASRDATGHDLRMVGQNVRQATARAGMHEISRFPIVSPTRRGPRRPGFPRGAGGREPVPSPGEAARILVVDDEEVVRMLVVDLLRERGYAVEEAEDAYAA